MATPTEAGCVPVSIETDAIAYDGTNDRFKVDVEKWSSTDTVDVNVTNASLAVAATQSGTWNIGTLTSITNTVTVSVSGTVTVSGTVAATQSGTWNIGTLTSITNTVTVSGSVTVSGTVSVSGTVTISGTVNVKASGVTTIIKSGYATDTSSTLHTVTTGKTFYLVSSSVSIQIIAGSINSYCSTEADTAGDSTFRRLNFAYGSTSELIDRWCGNETKNYTPPLPFAAGTVFRVVSFAASVYAYGIIVGWEE